MIRLKNCTIYLTRRSCDCYIMMNHFLLCKAWSLGSSLSLRSISSYFYSALASKRSARCSRISILKEILLISFSWFLSISVFFWSCCSASSRLCLSSSSFFWIISARYRSLNSSKIGKPLLEFAHDFIFKLHSLGLRVSLFSDPLSLLKERIEVIVSSLLSGNLLLWFLHCFFIAFSSLIMESLLEHKRFLF